MQIKVSDYISNYMADSGVTSCFMITGGGAMHLNDSIGHNSRIQCTFNHHEQACSIAAEGYARVTGNPALVCVTSGPGGTNAITGVMGAWLDSVPMIVISGQVKRETTIQACPDLGLRQLGDQEFDIIHSVSNMTKYAVMVTAPEEIAWHLEKAYHLATSGRKGPVWIDVPLDVQSALIDSESIIHYTPTSDNNYSNQLQSIVTSDHSSFVTSEINPAQIIHVAEKISKAKAPLFLVGTGIHLSSSERLLLDLVSEFEIPVVTAWNANDLIAYDNPKFAGMPGTVGTRAGNFALQNCDLLISLGCRMNIRMVGYNRHDFAKKAYTIAVDIDESELSKPTVDIDYPICGDVRQLLQELLSYAKKTSFYSDEIASTHRKWLKWCRERVDKYTALNEIKIIPDQHVSVNPYIFIDKLFDCLGEDDVIACSNGSACVVTFQAAKIKQGQRMFTNSGCASMGYGLPAALGAAVATDKLTSKRVICIEGDGSIMMNLQELATVAHNHLNIKIIILNNNGYHSIRQTQNNMFSPPNIGIDSETGVGFPDFAKLAEAFRLDYHFITLNNLDTEIEKILSTNEPAVVEVLIDSSQDFVPKVSAKIDDKGMIVSPSLNDMAPFLSDSEIKGNIY